MTFTPSVAKPMATSTGPDGVKMIFGPDEVVPTGRRILLISYYFPPAPDIGGVRWQQMSPQLAARGWSLDVIAGDLAQVANPDLERLKVLPGDLRIFSVPTREITPERIPLRIWLKVRQLLPRKRTRVASDNQQLLNPPRSKKRSSIVRGYLACLAFLYDRSWARDAARAAIALMDQCQYDLIVSSGPPHLAHEVARNVSSSSGVPYVMDMRDLWSLVERVPERIDSPIWWGLARHYERRAVSGASMVLMNTEVSKARMTARYPRLATRIHVVRNGSDNDPLPEVAAEERFTIRFAGSIYIDRNPRFVFRAAARLIQARSLSPTQFTIEFVGNVDRFADVPTMDIARAEGVADFVRVGGFLSRAETLRFLAGATMLLSLPQDSNSAIPAKIYEYVRFPAWLLILAEPESATAQLLRGTSADVIAPDNLEAILGVLRKRFDEFSSGKRPSAVDEQGRFARRLQTEKMVDLFEGLVGVDSETSSQ